MSALAEPIPLNAPPPSFLRNVGNISHPCVLLLWFSLTPETRNGYSTAIWSYKLFCVFNGIQVPWPAKEHILREWSTGRLFGSTSKKQGQIKPKTAEVYLSALRSYHIDQRMPTESFNSPWLQGIIKGGQRLFPSTKRQRFPVTKGILERITSLMSTDNIDNINYSTAFKTAWAGFLRVGEFTYTQAELKSKAFKETGLTRSDIIFAEDNSYAILRLKRSKTDINHQGVEIMLAAVNNSVCPVRALQRLFTEDPQLPHAPLFTIQGGPFTRKAVIDILHCQLNDCGIVTLGYSGHSFQKGAAQHASDNGMLEE